jgi:FdhD protein
MRTPGADRELGAGFLVTEGIVDGRDDIQAIAHCTDPNRANTQNVLLIRLAAGCDTDRLDRAQRSLYMTSSCGICGKASLENVMIKRQPRPEFPTLKDGALTSLENSIRRMQSGFKRTGGLHAAAVCNPDGEILAVYEDVGRHNAIDKVVGHSLFTDSWQVSKRWLWISGRASFEVVQKAHLGGFACVVAVGAPTSLAIELAKEARLGLIGFCRDGRANVYSGAFS